MSALEVVKPTWEVKPGWVYAVVNPAVEMVKFGMACVARDRWGQFDNLYGRYSSFSNAPTGPLWVHSETFHEDVKLAEHEIKVRLAHARYGGGSYANEKFHLDDPEVQRLLSERERIWTPLEERRVELRALIRAKAVA